jgi:DNA-binding HxlR family transcriptional regulator
MPTDNPTLTNPPHHTHWEQCAHFQEAIEFLGRRWTGTILYMLLNKPYRFNELLNTIPGISDRLLTERLRELEERGLVERHVLPQSPVRVEYRVTEAGRDVEEVLMVIFHWGSKWFGPNQE